MTIASLPPEILKMIGARFSSSEGFLLGRTCNALHDKECLFFWADVEACSQNALIKKRVDSMTQANNSWHAKLWQSFG